MKKTRHTRTAVTIGITGVIGSGKSTVASILGEFGIPVIDADGISRAVTRKGGAAFDKVVGAFGQTVIGADGELDRKELARMVFADPGKRKLLESIIHPEVQKARDEIIAALERDRPGTPVALDIPLLFEAGLDTSVDWIICAVAEEETLFSRVNKRDGMSRGEFDARLRSQLPLADKVRRSHFAVNTEKPVDGLRSELRAILEKIAPDFLKG